jgi:dynein heavy chain
VQVRSDLSNDARHKVNTLIITDVHARDIIDKFVRDSIMDAREFAWESQLRFYWDKAVVSSIAGEQNAATCTITAYHFIPAA